MIFIDASRTNNTPFRTGVEAYSFHLINALAKLAPDQITLVSPRKIPLDVLQLIIPFPRLWTQVRLSLEVWKNAKLRAGMLFIPSHLMPMVHPKNTIITIHDVAFKRFPECYSWASRTYLDWGVRFAVKHARTIIVPSQVTKSDLVVFYGCDPEKIVVIPHGYSPLLNVIPSVSEESHQSLNPLIGFDGEIPRHFIPRNDSRPYFLFIGRIERKKNLLTLIKAFEKFSANHPDFKLVLAGKPGIGGDEIARAAKNNPAITLTGYVDEPAKITLLKNAFAFVLPSLYEGFGFPILEAMEFNLPLICSDISASREVAGDAALYFKTDDAESLTAQMEKLVKDPATAESLTKKYPAILARHSWEECAKKTWEVLSV